MKVPDLNSLPDSCSRDDFWAMFGKVQYEQLDFKREVGKDLDETIAAMGMTEGGLILLGVANDRTLVGCPETQDVVDGIEAHAASCAGPVRVQRRGVEVEGVSLTIVAVPAVKDRIVTTSSGRLLRRSGSSNVPLRGEEVTLFVLDRLPSHVTPEQLEEAIEDAKRHASSEAQMWSLIS